MTNEELVNIAKEMIRLMRTKGVEAPIDGLYIALLFTQFVIRLGAKSKEEYLLVAEGFCGSLLDGFKELMNDVTAKK